MMALFFIGIVEMVIVTAWTKYVTQARVAMSGFITVINIFIWYYVLETIVTDIHNFWLIFTYALGCAIGTMIGTYYLGEKRRTKHVLRRVAQAFRIKVAM